MNKRKFKWKQCDFIFCIGLICVIVVWVSIPFLIKTIETKEVKCYDRYSNEIEDAICYEDNTYYTLQKYTLREFLQLQLIGMFIMIYGSLEKRRLE